MEVYMCAALVAVCLFVILICFRYFRRGRGSGQFPPDTIILHQLSRGPYAPSISPFCVKLETYLRMANLKYQSVSGRQMSSKSKVPWIELNGQQVADSQFCIEFLNKKFDVDLNRDLSSADRCIAQAFRRLAEDSLYWCVVMYRWVFRLNDSWLEEAKIPPLFRWYVCRFARSQTWGQGIGRHSRAEVDTILEGDLKALSDFLGTKSYMMGAEPCELDCAVFGQLSQFKWNLYGCLAHQLVTEKFPNLNAYCERMKTRYWPDWDALTLKGQEKK